MPPLPPDSTHLWVDAAPFRAHVHHLVTTTGIRWTVIAVVANVPPGLMSRLLFAQGGPPLRRLPLDCARRLVAITPDLLTRLRRASMPAAPTHGRLRELARRGWTTRDLAAALGCPTAEIEVLLSGRARSVPTVRAHAVCALLAAADRAAAGRVPCAA
ncbi:MAG: hypothetical protein ACK5LS_01280 [Propioniciclava sp.]